MKKNIFIIFLLLTIVSYSQDKKSTPTSYKRTNEKAAVGKEIEKNVKLFIDKNIKKYRLTSSKIKEITNWYNATDDEHELDKKSQPLSSYLNEAKKVELRKLYVQQNPESTEYLKSISKPAAGIIRNACDNGGFEEMITDDYDFSRRIFSTPYENFDCNLNANLFPITIINTNIINYNANITLTQSTPNAPIFDQSLFLMNNAIQIPVVNTGEFAIKLNNGRGGSSDQNVGTSMIKTFFLEPGESSVSYSFNFVCQNPTNHPVLQQPRFIARLYDSNGIVLSQNCLVSDVNNTLMFTNANPLPPGLGTATPLLYTDWQCASLSTQGVQNLPNQADREVTLEFIVIDCTQGAHFGSVYIDDICTTSECEDPVYGNLELDFDNVQLGNCPAFPLNICGTYLVPHSTNTSPTIYATLDFIELEILSGGVVINTISVPTTQSNNTPPLENTFCFELQESDFGTSPLSGDFEFQVNANFLSGGIDFPITVTSAIPGPDVSFNDCNCCSSCCPEHNVVTETVNSGWLHPKQAELTLTAKNIVNFNAIALYHAGEAVILSPPFDAVVGSKLHAYIDGCGDFYQQKLKKQEILTEIVKHNIETIELEEIGLDLESLLKVYPNPNNGIFKISLNGMKEGIIEVSDMNGKIIYQNTFHNQPDFEIDISGSSKGIYIVSLTSGDNVYFGKVIKK